MNVEDYVEVKTRDVKIGGEIRTLSSKEIKPIDEPIWWIGYDGDGTVHYGEIEVGSRVSTGQPNIEVFDNQEDCEDRVLELGGELNVPPGEYAEFDEVSE